MKFLWPAFIWLLLIIMSIAWSETSTLVTTFEAIVVISLAYIIMKGEIDRND